jgi:hypothetical protein
LSRSQSRIGQTIIAFGGRSFGTRNGGRIHERPTAVAAEAAAAIVTRAAERPAGNAEIAAKTRAIAEAMTKVLHLSLAAEVRSPRRRRRPTGRSRGSVAEG